VTRLAPLFLLAVALLSGCGAKEDVVEPSPLPDFQREVRVSFAWRASAGDGAAATGLRLQPAVTAQAVYTLDQSGLLQARARSDGKRLWSQKTALPFSAGPVAGYGQVIAGTRKGELVAYSAEDGKQLWKIQLGGEVLAPPALDADTVVVKATDGHISMIERASGRILWVHDGGVPVLTVRMASQPLLLADAVLAGLPTGVLVAIERGKGQVIWERRIAEPDGKSELDRLVDIAGDFLIRDDRLYVATYQGKVVAMDLRSGQFLWQQPFSTLQRLAASADALFGVDADGRVHAWRLADGVPLWKQELLAGRGLTGPSLSGTHLLVADAEGYVHVLRQADGIIAGRARIDRDGVAVAPVVDDGQVFVLGRGGRLASFSLE
jgi:outer membrane protein assembly factor BamB